MFLAQNHPIPRARQSPQGGPLCGGGGGGCAAAEVRGGSGRVVVPPRFVTAPCLCVALSGVACLGRRRLALLWWRGAGLRGRAPEQAPSFPPRGRPVRGACCRCSVEPVCLGCQCTAAWCGAPAREEQRVPDEILGLRRWTTPHRKRGGRRKGPTCLSPESVEGRDAGKKMNSRASAPSWAGLPRRRRKTRVLKRWCPYRRCWASCCM